MVGQRGAKSSAGNSSKNPLARKPLASCGALPHAIAATIRTTTHHSRLRVYFDVPVGGTMRPLGQQIVRALQERGVTLLNRPRDPLSSEGHCFFIVACYDPSQNSVTHPLYSVIIWEDMILLQRRVETEGMAFRAVKKAIPKTGLPLSDILLGRTIAEDPAFSDSLRSMEQKWRCGNLSVIRPPKVPFLRARSLSPTPPPDSNGFATPRKVHPGTYRIEKDVRMRSLTPPYIPNPRRYDGDGNYRMHSERGDSPSDDESEDDNGGGSGDSGNGGGGSGSGGGSGGGGGGGSGGSGGGAGSGSGSPASGSGDLGNSGGSGSGGSDVAGDTGAGDGTSDAVAVATAGPGAAAAVAGGAGIGGVAGDAGAASGAGGTAAVKDGADSVSGSSSDAGSTAVDVVCDSGTPVTTVADAAGGVILGCAEKPVDDLGAVDGGSGSGSGSGLSDAGSASSAEDGASGGGGSDGDDEKSLGGVSDEESADGGAGTVLCGSAEDDEEEEEGDEGACYCS